LEGRAVVELKPYYSYSEIARLERKSVATITGWISRDRKLPESERRFPGAYGGIVPLRDLKARHGWTNEDVKAMDLPEPVAPRVAAG